MQLDRSAMKCVQSLSPSSSVLYPTWVIGQVQLLSEACATAAVAKSALFVAV